MQHKMRKIMITSEREVMFYRDEERYLRNQRINRRRTSCFYDMIFIINHRIYSTISTRIYQFLLDLPCAIQ